MDSLKIKSLGYRIAILSEIKACDNVKDFHFVRENTSGTWSHKLGISALIEEKSYVEIPDNYELIKILKI